MAQWPGKSICGHGVKAWARMAVRAGVTGWLS
jgi:hypothetical protein